MKSLTDYVRDYLVGKHIRFYDNEVQEKSVIKNRKNIEKKSVSKKSATKETFAYSADLKVKTEIESGSKSDRLDKLFL